MQRLFMALALTLLAQLALSSPALALVNINTASQDELVALHKGLGRPRPRRSSTTARPMARSSRSTT